MMTTTTMLIGDDDTNGGDNDDDDDVIHSLLRRSTKKVRIVWSTGVRVVLKRTLLVTDVSTVWAEFIFRAKWTYSQ